MTRLQGNLCGFAACAGLLAYAYYAEFVLHLAPCPLCIFQRVGILSIGLVFLIAAAHDPVGWARRVYASLLALSALATGGVAVRHRYIQSLPEGSVPACGASLEFMLKVFSPSEVLVKLKENIEWCVEETESVVEVKRVG